MKISKTRKPVDNLKNLVFLSLAMRLTKFVLGTTLFFLFVIPSISAWFSTRDSFIVGSELIVAMFAWIFVTIVSRVLTIAYIIKVSFPDKIFMNIEPNSPKSLKLSVIKVTAIIGFFIPLFDVFSMVMFLVFAHNHKKESIDSLTPKIA
ncbi:hypothetical protein [Mesomycoplasma ovipneumoniae]|uniref:hypothetical protein n=1 Tax=Mesomycoplasma ovipneumoniae TaxID=29562 RepID=UPI0020CFC272|nr:hypothetical protein [Mesomycoplasma ovipneumoniae]